jgi:hypothetical protein
VQQNNDVDCGIYIITTAEAIAAGVDLATHFSKVTTSALRAEYELALVNNAKALSLGVEVLVERTIKQWDEFCAPPLKLTDTYAVANNSYQKAKKAIKDSVSWKEALAAAKLWLKDNMPDDLREALVKGHSTYASIPVRANDTTAKLIRAMAKQEWEMCQQDEIARVNQENLKNAAELTKDGFELFSAMQMKMNGLKDLLDRTQKIHEEITHMQYCGISNLD